jgi:biotin synthase
MMGNFLTTLGNEPETDREMFEELGLNVARHSDNASNPRPDNRSGWLSGETPDLVDELIAASVADGADGPRVEAQDGPAALRIRLWDPSRQLRYSAKRSVPPRPDGAPNRRPSRTPHERHPAQESAESAPVGAG